MEKLPAWDCDNRVLRVDYMLVPRGITELLHLREYRSIY